MSATQLTPISTSTSNDSGGRLGRLWHSRDQWGRPWAARVVWLLGALSIASALIPPLRHRWHLVAEVLPPFAPEVAVGATVATGALMLVLASGLQRGKKRAWQVATSASALLVLLHIVKGLDVEEALLSALVLAFLLTVRGAFRGLPDPRSRSEVFRVFLRSFAVATLVGVIALVSRPGRVDGELTVFSVLGEVWSGLIGLQGPLHLIGPRYAATLQLMFLMLGVGVLVVTLSAILRPARGPHALDAAGQEQLRALITAHGEQDSLSYFALRDNKSAIFSPSGKAAVAYAVIDGVSLASGDPLGDPEAWPGAIEAWLAEAESYAWTPGVLAAGERGAEAYHRAGMDALEMGDEAVIDVASFTLSGRSMRSVRQAVNRLQRNGYTVSVARANSLSETELAAVRNLADTWRDGQVERGFSMALGRFADDRDPDEVVVVAKGPHDEPMAMLAFVPWGSSGLSLDLMRRSPQADNGVVELMVTQLIATAAELGVRRVSLNFAVFREVFERGGQIGAGPALRLWHRVLLLASRFWQIESLYRANAKYAPDWQPRYVCFPRARDLPRIATAALTAEAFIVRTRLVDRVRRRASGY